MKEQCDYTYNYNIPLMTPMQADKEIFFNEAQSKLDSFCSSSVIGFLAEKPKTPVLGEKYILSTGENKGCIIYCTNLAKGWQSLKPKNGMIVFVHKEENFFIFSQNQQWSKALNLTSEENIKQDQSHFYGVKDNYTIPDTARHVALYLDGHTKITISKTKAVPLTVVIKQCYNNIYKIEWVSTILWNNKAPHNMTTKSNAIDIVQFYPMPETDHFLGSVLGQNYQY